MLKVTRNQKQTAYFIKLDIRSFFMSIDKKILFSLFEQNTDDDVILYLLSAVIFHDCTQDYYFKGNPRMLEKVPDHKSLFKIEQGKGLPIGNLTSQFFANVYLHSLDLFVKHQLKCRFYLRYVDDFILLSPYPDQLSEWREKIGYFLKEQLALELKPGDSIRRVSEGADFLGYIVKPSYMLSRKRVVNNLKYRLALFREKFVTISDINNRRFERILMEPDMIAELRQTLSSYLGHFKHANTFNLVKSLFEKNSWLKEIFVFHNGILTEKYKTRKMFRSLRAQVNFFRIALHNHILFFQVGKYIELYDDDALLMKNLFGLELKENFRGIKYVSGFPIHLTQKFIRLILLSGHTAAFIAEGEAGKYVCQRYVKEIYRRVGEA